MEQIHGDSSNTEVLNQAKQLAQSDYLTGLANRRGLYDYYDKLDKSDVLHAMFIDIDNFKRVNDSYGHSIGDDLLVSISHLIESCTNGFTSRIGGDEFVVMLEGTLSKEQVTQIAQTILTKMEEIDFRKDILSNISLSIGIVFYQHVSQPLDDILHKCDTAMYTAKFEGKNRYVVYKEFDRSVIQNRSIELEKEDALRRGDFVVYLQPKINMLSDGLYGAEALSRWEHPEDGVRVPNQYISVFEKNGFIARLDMYMYEEVCKLKASWRDKQEKFAHIPISVNMSRFHIYDKHFVEKLAQIADRYGIPHRELELEITESVFVKDSTELIHNVTMLKERDFLVSIDDFGSGLSALNLLQSLPVDIIKIDRDFLQDSAKTYRGQKVLRNIINLCRDLKIDVVAEGIENKEQIDLVTRSGCQIAQGFFYARPLPVHQFRKFAREYMKNIMESYHFRFDGSLTSEDGMMEGVIKGEGLCYVPGIFKDCQALHFPGGSAGKNVVYLPERTFINDSYAVSMWIRPEEVHLWASALYVRFETGFSSMLPLAWEGNSDFRIRDSKDVNGWYDTGSYMLEEGRWWYFSVSYNSKTETAALYINGERMAQLKDVPTQRHVVWVILGGDVFQPSFIGDICELQIFNEAKDADFMKELYDRYVGDENFIGFLGEEKR